MAYSSQPGRIGFGLQSVRGTAVPATRFMRLRSGSLGGNRDLLIPDPEIGGSRDTTGAYLGPIFFDGDLDFYPRLQSFALLAYGVLGLKASTSVAGPPVVGTHVITPGDVLPWMTVEEHISTNLMQFQYTDAKVNSLHMEADATSYLTGTANLLALKQTPSFPGVVTPVYDNSPMMVGNEIQITLDGAHFCVKSFSLDINNNIENDDFCMGDMGLADLTEKQREVTMGFTYRPEDDQLWRAAMYGNKTATTPLAGPAYQGAFSMQLTTFETIGGIPAGTPFSMLVSIPHAAITPFKVTPSGDDPIQADISVTALRPDPLVPLITITIKDDLATIS